MQYKIITPVSVEPVTLAEAKLHIRVTVDSSGDTAEDNLIMDLIKTAREYCENFTGRALATQTIEAYLNGFPCANYIELPRPPLQSVTSVKYKNRYNVETTMTVDTDYIVDTDSDVGRIVLPYGLSWPSFTPHPVNPIKIRYVAGYEEAPASIRQSMLLLIGHWYANREATGEATGQIEFAVKALLSQHRMRWF